jgi:cell division protein FtsB
LSQETLIKTLLQPKNPVLGRGLFVKKEVLAIVASAILAIFVVALFGYSQISALQNQIGELQAQNGELQDQNSDLQAQVSEIQDKLDESQNQISEQQDILRDITYELALERPLHVLIAKFNWVGDFNPIGGLTIGYSVKVTVQNTDATALSGLALTVRLLIKGTLTEVKDSRGFSMQIDQLKAGESREITGMISATLDSFNTDSALCAIRLGVKDIILDEGTYNLS